MLIAQLSDLHVCRPGFLYKGVADSNAQFSAAIRHLEQFDQRPDVVVITGDLVDEGHPEEYAHLRELLLELTLPYFVIPGNHDDRDHLREAFRSHGYLPQTGPLQYCIDDYPVRILALDSTVPGAHHGLIDPGALEWLSAALASDPTKPTIILLHHPPFLSGIPYMDRYRLQDEASLAGVLSKANNVEAVLCGHVHRPMVRRFATTLVAACPSTTTEIALQLDPAAKPRSYLGPPACMLHLWQAGAGLISHTSYIGAYPGPYPFF